MSLPKVLKNMNVFVDGTSFLGEIPEISLPKLSRKMVTYRGGGMDAEVDLDMGGDKLEIEIKPGGHITKFYKLFGLTTHDGAMLRFMGSYQEDSTGQTTPIEIIARGRFPEIDPGSAKPGDKTEETIKMTCSYYRLIVNGAAIVEIDIANFIFNVNGVDRLAQQRAALGI